MIVLVAGFNDLGVVKVMIVGNDIEGSISAVQGFVENQEDFIFLTNPHAFFVDDENLEAIKVYDYVHNPANSENYMRNNDAFRNVVKNSLYKEFFTTSDKTVTSDNGIDLRLRNIKPDFSAGLIEYINSTGVPVEVPVVLARGLWSNLTDWESFGGELASLGRDTWLIEITGGPNTECDLCPDYSFDDLTDYYVPGLLNGVLDFTQKDKLQFVGFSNGCRSALSSMERGKFDTARVESFVGVGCPGSFEKVNPYDNSTISSIGSDILNEYGQDFISNAIKNKFNHISIKNLISFLFEFPRIFGNEDTKISLKLFEYYYNISSQDSDKQLGINLTIRKFAIVEGDQFVDDDIMVFISDQKGIYDNINSNNKIYLRYFGNHLTMPNKEDLKRLIKKILHNESFSFYERTFNIKEKVGS